MIIAAFLYAVAMQNLIKIQDKVFIFAYYIWDKATWIQLELLWVYSKLLVNHYWEDNAPSAPI